MKKVVSLLLALVLALSLCACGGSEYEKYAKYADLFEMLEGERWQDAVAAILEMEDEAADGEEKDDGKEKNDGNKDEGAKEPTAEESELLFEYSELCDRLNQYAEGDYTSIKDPETEEYLEGSEMLAYIYKRLQELDSIDRWIAEGKNLYDDDTPRDRMKVLEGFGIVEDVLYKSPFVDIDHMGNVESNYAANTWGYDKDGTMTYYYNNRGDSQVQNRFYEQGHYFYEYDAAGKVKIITRKNGSEKDADITAVYTPVYDAAGNEISCTVKSNSGEKTDTFTYDAAGNMTGMVRVFSGSVDVTEFVYDAEGKLVEEKCTTYLDYGKSNQRYNKVRTCVYTYEGDALKEKNVTTQSFGYTTRDGVREYYVREETVDTVAVECDAQGRVVKETTTYGDKLEVKTGEKTPASKVSRTIEYIYGDYYLYTPVQ